MCPHLKNTLLSLEPWIMVWHIVQAWYLAAWLWEGPAGPCVGNE
jgi:hypothetical protein